MSPLIRGAVLYAVMAALILAVGWFQSWTVALTILNFGLISAIMALGVNIQWGYAGLFNVGIMGFAALGGSFRLRLLHAFLLRRTLSGRHFLRRGR